MNRLSALDAAFLYLETPDTPMHIGCVTTFGPAMTADDLFERFWESAAAEAGDDEETGSAGPEVVP